MLDVTTTREAVPTLGPWLASHIPTAIPHLFDNEGHLSLGITRFGDILDALVASGR